MKVLNVKIELVGLYQLHDQPIKKGKIFVGLAPPPPPHLLLASDVSSIGSEAFE